MHRGSNAPLLFCNLKLYNMDKGTLIKVVAMIDSRLAEITTMLESDTLNADNIRFLSGGYSALEIFGEELQKAIDADVAAMESSTGE